MSNHGTPYVCTNGQLATVISRLTVALPQALEASGLDIKTILKYTNEGEKLSLAIAEAFNMLYHGNAAVMPKQTAPLLKQLAGGLIIPACDGTETLASAKDVFAWIDPNFKNWETDKPGKATKKTTVNVYEMVKDATFARMFGSLGVDLDKLCLTQHQIKAFSENHLKWVRTDGCANFSLFKVGDQFFVAYPHENSVGWYACVRRFGDDFVWNAKNANRLVVPQLTV